MPYKDKNKKTYTYAKNGNSAVAGVTYATNGKVGAGARMAGDGNDVFEYSMLEADTYGGYNVGLTGAEAEVGVRAHLFNLTDHNVGNPKAKFRAGGVEAKGKVGLDPAALVNGDKCLGVEGKARATLSEGKAGPLECHIGAGVSTTLKVDDLTFEAKLGGSGVKLGKRLGVSAFDNEISIEALSLVGKGWLWGEFD